MLKEFCETTTFHGFSDFHQSSRCWRFFWISIIVASVITTFYFIYAVIDGFADAPLNTSSQQVYLSTLELPEIAICTSSRLNTSKMELDGFEPEMIRALLNKFQSYHSYSMLNSTENHAFRAKIETELNAANISSLEALAETYAFSCKDIVKWCEEKSIEQCCNNTRIVVHIEYSGCVVLPRRKQEWAAAAAGWTMLLKAPKLSDFYANALFYDGFFIEFSHNYHMYTYDSTRIPLGYAVDIALEATKFQRLAQKAWPKIKTEPLCIENLPYSFEEFPFKFSCIEGFVSALVYELVGLKKIEEKKMYEIVDHNGYIRLKLINLNSVYC